MCCKIYCFHKKQHKFFKCFLKQSKHDLGNLYIAFTNYQYIIFIFQYVHVSLCLFSDHSQIKHVVIITCCHTPEQLQNSSIACYHACQISKFQTIFSLISAKVKSLGLKLSKAVKLGPFKFFSKESSEISKMKARKKILVCYIKKMQVSFSSEKFQHAILVIICQLNAVRHVLLIVNAAEKQLFRKNKQTETQKSGGLVDTSLNISQ